MREAFKILMMGGLFVLLIRQRPSRLIAETRPQDEKTHLTEVKAKFIDQNVQQYYAFVLSCFDANKKSAEIQFQWLSGFILVALGFTGGLIKAENYPLAAGAIAAILYALPIAGALLNCLHTKEMEAPGYLEPSLTAILHKPAEEIIWLASKKLSERATKNKLVADSLADSVDHCRKRILKIPFAFAFAALVGWLITAYLQGAIR